MAIDSKSVQAQKNNGHSKHQQKDQNCQLVQFLVSYAKFARWHSAVQYATGLAACVYNKTNCVTGCQNSPRPQRIFQIKSISGQLRTLNILKHSFKFVNIHMRRLTLYSPICLFDQNLLIDNALRWNHCFTQLPVCLSIKLVCADEYGARFVACMQEDHVGGYAFVSLDFYQVSYLNILALNCFVHSILPDTQVRLLVHCAVTLPPCQVFCYFLRHGHKKNKSQWGPVCEDVSHLQHWKELRNRNQQEEEIEEKLELVKQYERYKGEYIVLCVGNTITRATFRQAAAVQMNQAITIRVAGPAGTAFIAFVYKRLSFRI